MSVYDNPFGSFRLKRIPDTDKNLQAWSSADTYLLNHLSEQFTPAILKQSRILVMNDDFGALTVSLAQFGCDSLSDSYVSHQAIKHNIETNCPDYLPQVQFIKSTEELKACYDLVLFKVPKTNAWLKQQMLNLAGHISDRTQMFGAIMAKNLRRSVIDTLNQWVGPAQASLAWKKARLIDINHPSRLIEGGQKSEDIAYFNLDDGSRIAGLSNVFSRNRLDIGARFFLEHFPARLEAAPETIIDLGCGNGVLSLKAAQCYPQARIMAIDESYMAVESAKMTLQANIKNISRIQFISTNVLEDVPSQQAGLILCNPPFHQQHVVGDAIAWQMFVQSLRVLKKAGELWVVGNRHLGYHARLKKVFGNQSLIATNNKFVLLKAIKH